MSYMRTVCLLFILLLISTGLFAQQENPEQLFNDGNYLLKLWRIYQQYESGDTEAVTFSLGFFLGTVRATAETLDFYDRIDLPENSKASQWFRVVGKYLEDHPEFLHLPSVAIVIVALEKAFPKK